MALLRAGLPGAPPISLMSCGFANSPGRRRYPGSWRIVSAGTSVFALLSAGGISPEPPLYELAAQRAYGWTMWLPNVVNARNSSGISPMNPSATVLRERCFKTAATAIRAGNAQVRSLGLRP